MECSIGHVWNVRPSGIIYDRTWCPKCSLTRRSAMARLPQHEAHRRAQEAGYEFVGPYKKLGLNTQMKHVPCGTVLCTSLASIMHGQPCRVCNGKAHLNSDAASRHALDKGGALVAWAGVSASRSTWRCSKGHEWLAAWDAMYRTGSWCRKCKIPFRKSKQALDTSGDIFRLSKRAFSTYKKYDQVKGLAFDLTVQDVIQAKSSPCHYCGRSATGFDRVDNNLGHTRDNCIPACIRCNWVRGNYLSHSVMEQVGELLKRIDP